MRCAERRKISTGITGSAGLRRQRGPSSEAFTAITDITASLSSLARVHTETTEDTEFKIRSSTGSTGGHRVVQRRETRRAKRVAAITHHSSLERFHTEITENTEFYQRSRDGLLLLRHVITGITAITCISSNGDHGGRVSSRLVASLLARKGNISVLS